MLDLHKLWIAFQEILKENLGDSNELIPPIVTICLLVVILIGGIYSIIWFGGSIKGLFREKLRPCFYDSAQKWNVRKRQFFTKHLEIELYSLSRLENWNDHRFVELEAEFESKRPSHFHFLSTKRSENRGYESKLSKALHNPKERLTLLEGAPGSGKTVSLRRVALMTAEKTMQSRHARSTIPLYIDLKGLSRKKSEAIDQQLIEKYVLEYLDQANDRDVTVFLEENFRKGIEEGTWFFLLDSFDEIPDIIKSTETDHIVADYVRAFSDFLGGTNQCCSILASSRDLRPYSLNWPVYRIRPLQQSVNS